MAPALSAAELRDALLAAGDEVAAAKDELNRLDGIAGDGDLGSTLAGGWTALAAVCDTVPTTSAGAVLDAVGAGLAEHAPSTMGTLLAFGMRAAGQRLGSTAVVDGAAFADLLDAVAGEVEAAGGARPGERTALDALDRARLAATEASRAGEPLDRVAAAAATAAELGAEATSTMSPRHGRARWVGDRANGRPDAGAVACARWLRALAGAVARSAAEDPA